MKEFSIRKMVGGVQLNVLVVAKTKSEAVRLLGVSLYRFNGYGHSYEPKTELAIKSPYLLFAYFDSGWLSETFYLVGESNSGFS